MGPDGGVPQGASELDASGVGDGTIGTGNVPSAGESGFTGNASQFEE